MSTHEQYATDSSEAEAQKSNHGGTLSLDKPPGNKTDTRSPYTTDYRPDALVWSLYLKETEAEDKDMVSLWRTGVDSLLTFAGLFAGILTAFLLESRTRLQGHPSGSSLLVNYAWFTSLTLTLISALCAVLAKGWLEKYSPASRGASSSDACERHLRVIRAQQWRFAGFISGIPILIQLALFLFFAGLVSFIFHDNKGIAYTILALIAFTAAMYLFGTIFPWFSPACPLQTSMSDFIPKMTKKIYKEDHASSYHLPKLNPSLFGFLRFAAEVRRMPEQLEVEVNILSWIIMNSAVEDTIDVAVKVVVGMPSAHFDVLKKSGAIQRLCERFSRFFKFSPGLHVTAVNVNQAEVYLYALSALAKTDPESCIKLWKQGGPLHRWDNLQPCLQLLALCARTEVLLANKHDDHQESWEQTKRNLASVCRTGSTRALRVKLMDVAFRSLGERGYVLRCTGAILLASLVKIGNMDAVKAWLLSQPKIITNLCVLLADSDDFIRDAALQVFTKLAYYGAFRHQINSAVPKIVKLLDNKDENVRSAGANVIGKLAEHTSFHDVIKPYFPQIVQWLEDKDGCVRSAAAIAINTMVAHPRFHDEIEGAVPQIVRLLKDKDWNVRSAVSDVISKLTDSQDRSFHDAIKNENVIPQIVTWLKDKDRRVNLVGANAIGRLAAHSPFHDEINTVVRDILKLHDDDIPNVRSACVNTISKLFEYTPFHDTVKGAFPQIIKLLNDSDSNVRATTANAIRKLAEYPPFHKEIMTVVPQIVILLDNKDSFVRSAGENAIGTLVAYTSFHQVIETRVPEIVKLLENENGGVQSSGAITISKLIPHTQFHDRLKDVVPQIVKLLKDEDWSVRSAAARAIRNLADHSSFHDAIKDAVPDIIAWLKDENRGVRLAAANAIGMLAVHNDTSFHDVIKDASSKIIEVLKKDFSEVQWTDASALGKRTKRTSRTRTIKDVSLLITKLLNDVQSDAANAVGNLAGYSPFHDAIKDFVPEIVKLLKDQDRRVRSASANAIGKLVVHNIFHDSIVDAVPQIVKLLKDNDCSVRLAAAIAFGKVAEHPPFHDVVTRVVPDILELLKGREFTVLWAGANALGKLAKRPPFHDTIKGAVPQILGLLKQDSVGVRYAAELAILSLAKHVEIYSVFQTDMDSLLAEVVGEDAHLSRVACIAIKAIDQRTDPATWLGNALSPLFMQFSAIPANSARLSSPYMDILSSFSYLSSKDCEQRYGGMQCLFLLVRCIRTVPVRVTHFSSQVMTQLESSSGDAQCHAAQAVAR